MSNDDDIALTIDNESPLGTPTPSPTIPLNRRRAKRASPPRRAYNYYRTTSHLLTALCLAVGALFALASHRHARLPTAHEVLTPLKNDPVQSPTSRTPFNFTFAGRTYRVTPLAEYELYGTVVTHNNPTGWGDIYHDDTSVDVKDLCVIWGDNARSALVRSMTFWSESWTCNAKADTEDQFDAFSMTELSNNHLLPATPAIHRAISDTTRGDQIHLRGMLVSYSPREAPEQVRMSSLVRTDQGDGACEVIFVESFELLRRVSATWENIYRTSKMALGFMLAIKLLTFLAFPYFEYRAGL